jgi:hypothetical protein
VLSLPMSADLTEADQDRVVARAGLKAVHCTSEGVAGDGAFWRSRPGLLLGRVLDRGDILRMSFTR